MRELMIGAAFAFRGWKTNTIDRFSIASSKPGPRFLSRWPIFLVWKKPRIQQQDIQGILHPFARDLLIVLSCANLAAATRLAAHRIAQFENQILNQRHRTSTPSYDTSTSTSHSSEQITSACSTEYTDSSSEMSSKTKKPAGKAQRSAIADVVAREYTIHLHKRVRRIEKFGR